MSLLTPLVNKVYKAATTPDARGMLSSSFENLIRNYYSPSPKATEVAEKVGDVVGPVGSKVVGAGAKAYGLMESAVDGAKNFIKMQDPYNAAVYRTGGVNPVVMQKEAKKDVTANVQNAIDPEKQKPIKEEQEFANRALYLSHNTEQSAREGNKSPILGKLVDKISVDGGYKKITEPGFYQRGVKFQNKTIPGQVMTKEEADIVERLTMAKWKDQKLTDKLLSKVNEKMGTKFNIDAGVPLQYGLDDKFIMKRATTGAADHTLDIVNKNGRTPLKYIVEQVYAQGLPKNVDELVARLKQVTLPKRGKKQMSFRIEEVDSTGVYIDFSLPGVGITEGGVNILLKLKPNGKGFGVLSDEHNFLEWLPIIKNLIPKRLLAMTTPVNFNLRREFPKQLGNLGSGRKPVLKEETNPKILKKKKEESSWDDFAGPADKLRIREAVRDKNYVDPEILKQEQIKAILKAVGIGGAGYQTMKED